MKKILLVFLSFFCLATVYAQELKMDVQISTPTLNFADPKSIETLKTAISEFFNNNKWTSDNYKPEERIEASLLINIKEDRSPTNFKADFRLQSVRPVYKSTYTSPLMSFIDKDVSFSYQEFQPIENSATSYVDNLSSILTYYAYIIMGFDYDSFENYGGNPHLEVAQQIINNIPSNVSQADRSWTVSGPDRSRYWMLENLNNPRARKFREAFYEYHRLGMDGMYEDADRARAIILSTLNTVAEINKNYPNSMIVQMFTDAKKEEIVEIFAVSNIGEKKRVYDIMVKLDPARTDQYVKLKK